MQLTLDRIAQRIALQHNRLVTKAMQLAARNGMIASHNFLMIPAA